MIYSQVRRRFRFLQGEDAVDEIVQRVRIGLWRYSLPRYDAWTHNKVSTYLHVCIRNLVVTELRAHLRECEKRRGQRPLTTNDVPVAPDRDADRAIELLADDVRCNLRKYLGPIPARIAARMIDVPGVTKAELSDGLDIRRPSVPPLIRQAYRDIARLLDNQPLIGRNT